MRKLISVLVSGGVVALVLAIAAPAEAQIYKYRKKDGTVVYTDKLSDLPKKARAKYAKRARKERQEREKLEASLGKNEVARREMEAKRKAELERQIAAADAVRRRQELQALLRRLNEEEAEREEQKKSWQKRLADARAAVKELYEKYKKTKEEYDSLAVRADYALFPGQNQKKFKLQEELEVIKKELEAAIQELEVNIPKEAKKAGIPPGWLR